MKKLTEKEMNVALKGLFQQYWEQETAIEVEKLNKLEMSETKTRKENGCVMNSAARQ